MTNSEAIKVLKETILLIKNEQLDYVIAPDRTVRHYPNAIQLAIKALNATKKVKSTWTRDYDGFYYHRGCKNGACAGEVLFKTEYKYCPNCGKDMFEEDDI